MNKPLWVRGAQIKQLADLMFSNPDAVAHWKLGIEKGYVSPTWDLVSDFMMVAQEVLDERESQTLPPDIELFGRPDDLV